MCEFNILVQNKDSVKTYKRHGYIKANSIQNAMSNIYVAFSSFQPKIINVKLLNK